MLTITTSSTQDTLAELADVKAQLSITTTDNDATLEFLIEVATERIEDEIGYTVRRQSYQERVQAFGLHELLVSQRPLVSIDSIWRGTDSGDPVSTDQYVLENERAGIIYGNQPFSWDVGAAPNLSVDPIRGQERLAYIVNYDAGWIYPGSTGSTGTLRTLPKPIEQAVIETAKAFYVGRKTVDSDIEKKKIGQLEVTYGRSTSTSKMQIPDIAMMLIDSYRSLA